MAGTINGDRTFEKPAGSPQLRSVMRVVSWSTGVHVYVVSMGNGPSAVRMTRCCRGAKSTNSYVYVSRRPRKRATNSTRVPVPRGGGVLRSTDLMFSYHAGALAGSAA